MKKIDASETYIRGWRLASGTGIIVLAICLALNIFLIVPVAVKDNTMWIFVILVFVISILLFLFITQTIISKGRVEIPIGKCGILIEGNEVTKDKIYTEGIHWIQAWYSRFQIFPNENVVNTEEYSITEIPTFNRVFVDATVQIQYFLKNPFERIYQNNIDVIKSYRSKINQSICSFIIQNEISNQDIHFKKLEIEKNLIADLSSIALRYGEEIFDVNFMITKMDENWKIIWRNQSEIDFFIDRLTKLAKLEGMSIEKAFEQIAVREGWIKAQENIFTIKGAEEIISLSKRFL